MTTLDQLRRAALALPEVEEGTRAGTVAFRVRGRGIASVTPDGQVRLPLPDAETEAALAACPSGARLVRGGVPTGLCAPLADVDGMLLNALVRASWFGRAPQRLDAALAAAEGAADRPGELPAGIGKPATRALFGAGVSMVEQVAAHTEDELLALHGVGPKAVRILAAALAERGMSLRSP